MISLLMVTASLAILLPYFAFVMSFLSPVNVIRKMQNSAIISVKQLKTRPLPESKKRMLDSVDELQDIAKRALELSDRSVEMASINALHDLIVDYQPLAANIGVLLGLIVLIIEIGQNTEMMRAQMTQERTNHLVQKFDANIHSDYWPTIAAKRDEASSTSDWIESLTGEEYQRVLNAYYRDISDIRNQFYQYQQGYLPQEVWDASTRGQIIRLLNLGSALGRPERFEGNAALKAEIKDIAETEKAPFPNDDGTWP